MSIKWIRTCQECFHKQEDTQPNSQTNWNEYSYTKCKKCKSEALDYGSEVDLDATNDEADDETN